MRLSVKLLVLAMAVGICAFPAASSATASSIMLDPNGGGDGFIEIDHIVYQTDTGLSVGFNPFAQVPNPDDPYSVDFLLQGRVGTASLDGNIVNIAPVPFDYQMTFTTKFTETVIDQGVDPDTGFPQVSFSAGEDVNSLFRFYINSDLTADVNTAQGYTDGVMIFEGHLLSLTSSFESAVPGQLGTGSFNVWVSVDSFDADYLQFPAETFLMRLVSTGTLNQPTLYTPEFMWDGTATEGQQMFKFDGSTDFNVVPEPGTLVLLGLGLTGLAVVARRRK